MSVPSRASPPILPMLAQAADAPPREGDYVYEFKWEGVRAIAEVRDGRVRLWSRNGNELTHQYPEVLGLGSDVPTDAILDGELVALDDLGRPSFQRLQARMGVGDRREALRRSQLVPVYYMVFDLLAWGGEDLRQEPYEARRARLDALRLSGPHWRVPGVVEATGVRALDESRRLGLEGIVAKRRSSPYRPGQRTGEWLKIKNRRGQEFVVGGWLEGEGARSGTIGALLLGYYDPAGRLRYAGRVGTGFTQATLASVLARLRPLEVPSSPFADGPPPGARFVRPELVAEVVFQEWTDEGRLRHPSFQGLREDKPAAGVVREREVPVHG